MPPYDFIVLSSVFTHMTAPGVENYLAEIRRLLAPQGRCLISYFLLGEESLRLISEGRSTIDFRHAAGPTRMVSLEVPEYTIAYDEDWVRALYARLGLDISRILYGSWCGREKYYSAQDMILATPARRAA